MTNNNNDVRTVEGEVLGAETETDPSILEDPSVIEKLKELTVTSQVEAVKQGKQFFTVDDNLNPVLAGYIQRLDFDAGKARGLVFINRDDSKQYSLGNPGRKQTNLPIISHHKVLQPIANSGFEVANIVHNRGGAGVYALFQHPEIRLQDIVNWDAEQYGQEGDGYLRLSICAWIDARLGKSIRLAVGFFREICSNGLVGAILGLGHLRITHNQFSAPRIEQFVQSAIDDNQSLNLETFSPKILNWPIKILDAHQRDSNMIETLPTFVAKPFMSSLGSLPNWAQDEFLYQMNLAKDSDQAISTLDVMNMITNVNNTGENDSLLFRTESISESFVQLLEVAAFKQNLDFPSVLTNVNVDGYEGR